MQKILRLFLATGLLVGASQGASAASSTKTSRKSASTATVARSSGSTGDLEVVLPGLDQIAISITGTPELVNLANTAFNAHGRYRRVASGGQFELRFTSAGPNAVRVDVMKGPQAVLSQNVSGASTRNALFRAADLAVKATSGLNGFFASKLAFVSDRSGKSEVFVSDLFMGEAHQITHDNAHALSPRWSPDGSKLLYTSFFQSGYPDIFLIDLASQQRTIFARFKGTNTGARYSPNGSQVVMVLSGEGNPEIYVSDGQGRHPVRRTRTPDTVESSPCFSPDGSQIVYAAGESNPQLYIMSAAGGSPRRIASGLSSYCSEPDWSRTDPNKIIFTMREGNRFQIAELDLSAGAPHRVSRADFDGVEPVWLADARHVVYTARSASAHYLAILDTETGKSTRLGTVLAEKASVWGP